MLYLEVWTPSCLTVMVSLFTEIDSLHLLVQCMASSAVAAEQAQRQGKFWYFMFWAGLLLCCTPGPILNVEWSQYPFSIALALPLFTIVLSSYHLLFPPPPPPPPPPPRGPLDWHQSSNIRSPGSYKVTEVKGQLITISCLG